MAKETKAKKEKAAPAPEPADTADDTPTSDSRFDVRLIEAHLRRGDISATEHEKHLAALPDDAAEGEPSKVAFTSPFADRHYQN
jgi:hypothetical protein